MKYNDLTEQHHDVIAKIKHEFLNDFEGFMIDLGKDISNKISECPGEVYLWMHTETILSFFAFYLSKLLCPYTSETIEDVLHRFVLKIAKDIPSCRQELEAGLEKDEGKK
jgi:hypothetical protein